MTLDTNTKSLEGLQVTGVPVTFVNDEKTLAKFLEDFADASEHALDTETYGWQDGGDPQLRVLSAAAVVNEVERAWVVDCRDIDICTLIEGLENIEGLEASGWNANYDAGVFDIALGRRVHVAWWDAMLSDAVCHQGETGFDFYQGLAKVARLKCGIALDGKGTTQVSYDGESDLTQEQIRYAALDAVATMRVAREIREDLRTMNLEQAASLEQRARPFLAAMKRHGLPIDWEGWKRELDRMQGELDESLARLAELTGGGQADIFSMQEKPNWKPDSSADVKRILNEYESDRVKAYFNKSVGEARLFTKADKADKDTLKGIGGALVEELLEYKNRKKVLSTYGDNLTQYIGQDGRMHPEYLQVIGTDTGRLSSRNPNAQNFTPKLKPFFRPAQPVEGAAERVFVYADLSQAELRFLAQVSGDEAMREAFRQGKDIHVATSERMFGVDMDVLKDSDAKKHKEYRSKAKTLNFGIVYGLGPGALANSLTLSGVPTTPEEAKGLLKAYLEAYPGVREWLAKRDGFVRGLADSPARVDLRATLELKDLFGLIKSTVGRFRKAEGREPDDDELVDDLWPTARIRREFSEELGREPNEDETAQRRLALRDKLAWARTYRAPVVLGMDGNPVGFTSYTEVGRQRRFQIPADSLLLAMANVACQSRKDTPKRLRDSFARTRGIELSRNGQGLNRDELAKVFEDRALRREFVEYIIESMGAQAAEVLTQRALGDRISAMGNAYRNAPIQGGVADVVLDAYGRLWDALGQRDDVWPVQTVHDSISLEVNAEDADEIAKILKESMETAMSLICPDVPAKADADIRTSLDDASVVREL